MGSFDKFVKMREATVDLSGTDDRVRKYVNYLSKKHTEPLEEAAIRSIARVHSQMNDNLPHAIFTAFRGERTLPQNRAANSAMEVDIRRNGWGYIPILGGFREKIRDVTGMETGEERDVDEESYFITGQNDRDTFKIKVLEIIKKYQQEAAVVKYNDSPIAVLLDVNGSETPLGVWNFNTLAKYYTKMKKGPADRKFTFEAAGDVSRSAMMAMDYMFRD